jgi:hypothetical protein
MGAERAASSGRAAILPRRRRAAKSKRGRARAAVPDPALPFDTNHERPEYHQPESEAPTEAQRPQAVALERRMVMGQALPDADHAENWL